MRKRLLNKLTMYKAVRNHLKQNELIWNSIPAMVTVVNDFDLLISKIDAYHSLTSAKKKGITKQLATRQETLISHAYELSSLLLAMGSQKNDQVLMGKINFTESGLVKKRDNELVIVCRIIADLVFDNLLPLASYGVTENDHTLLMEEIKLFSDSLPKGRLSVGEKKTANAMMKLVFLDVDTLLKKQLDRLMVSFRRKHVDFYNAYLNTRRIVNYGIRHEPEKEKETAA